MDLTFCFPPSVNFINYVYTWLNISASLGYFTVRGDILRLAQRANCDHLNVDRDIRWPSALHTRLLSNAGKLNHCRPSRGVIFLWGGAEGTEVALIRTILDYCDSWMFYVEWRGVGLAATARGKSPACAKIIPTLRTNNSQVELSSEATESLHYAANKNHIVSFKCISKYVLWLVL